MIRWGARLGGCLALVVAVVSCNKPPTQPGPLPPIAPTEPGLSRIDVAGPRTVAPGQVVGYTLTAHFRDGSSRDVTSEGQWHTSSSSTLDIDAAGQARGGLRGDTTVTGMFRGMARSLPVVVVPDGTYRLSGVVKLSDVPDGVVVGARVEVMAAAEPLEAQTDFGGRYVLFGVAGSVRIRISRPDYHTLEQTVHVTSHQSTDFSLTASQPPLSIAGTYTLKITLDTSCVERDPGPEARDRTYTATITHLTPTTVSVTLTGADLVVSRGSGNNFTGLVEPSGATFALEADYYGYDYPDLVEYLSNGTYVVPTGRAVTRQESQGLVGTMQGALLFYNTPPGDYVRPSTSCSSKNIRFALLK
jgi:hypothetical protein